MYFMSIFNSLGSNYNFQYILKSLSITGNSDLKLKNLIEKKYEGKAVLTYKGREALVLALKIIKLPKDSAVAINGFTCVAVFNSIRTAGYEPACLDLEKDLNLNFSPESLEKALKSNKNIKAVVVQNTLGYPCDIERIEQICKKNNLILIEDLAHCVGTIYSIGKEAGTVGDMVVLSFSQDKVIDAVSGGALVVRNKKIATTKFPGACLIHPEGVNVLKDWLYPHITYKIRLLYNFRLGKPYHFLLKKLGLMSNVMNESFYGYYCLSARSAMLTLFMFERLDKQLSHRRKIARVYIENLDTELIPQTVAQQIDHSTNLRFPIFVEDRSSLVRYLGKYGVFLSDIWYQDVAPECPNAIEVSRKILNLPTHINVSERDAKRICKLINKWLK